MATATAARKTAARAANLEKVKALAGVLDGMAAGSGQALHDLLSDLAEPVTVPARRKATAKK